MHDKVDFYSGGVFLKFPGPLVAPTTDRPSIRPTSCFGSCEKVVVFSGLGRFMVVNGAFGSSLVASSSIRLWMGHLQHNKEEKLLAKDLTGGPSKQLRKTKIGYLTMCWQKLVYT